MTSAPSQHQADHEREYRSRVLKVCLHEAAHGIVGTIGGGQCTLLCVHRRGGRAWVRVESAIGQMLMLAAGVEGERACRLDPDAVFIAPDVPSEEIARRLPFARLPADLVAACDFDRAAMATEFAALCGDPVKSSDQKQFRRILWTLARAGMIKSRKDFQTRWWWRMRLRARRMLEENRETLRALAIALAEKRLLLCGEIDQIISGKKDSAAWGAALPEPLPFAAEKVAEC